MYRFQTLVVERVSVDKLTQLVWKFRYWDDKHALLMQSYVEYRRLSKRHKFLMRGDYWMSQQSARNMRWDSGITLIDKSAVHLPADVVSEVRGMFVDTLTVGIDPRD
jgi:hypothetical protein